MTKGAIHPNGSNFRRVARLDVVARVRRLCETRLLPDRPKWLEWCERVPPMENHNLQLQSKTVRNPYPQMIKFLLKRHPDLRFQDCYVDGNDWSVGNDAYRDDHPVMQFVARQLDLMRTEGLSKQEAFARTEELFRGRRDHLENEQKVMMAMALDAGLSPMFTTGRAYLEAEKARSETAHLATIRRQLREMKRQHMSHDFQVDDPVVVVRTEKTEAEAEAGEAGEASAAQPAQTEQPEVRLRRGQRLVVEKVEAKGVWLAPERASPEAERHFVPADKLELFGLDRRRAERQRLLRAEGARVELVGRVAAGERDSAAATAGAEEVAAAPAAAYEPEDAAAPLREQEGLPLAQDAPPARREAAEAAEEPVAPTELRAPPAPDAAPAAPEDVVSVVATSSARDRIAQRKAKSLKQLGLMSGLGQRGGVIGEDKEDLPADARQRERQRGVVQDIEEGDDLALPQPRRRKK